MPADISSYHKSLNKVDREICSVLFAAIEESLSKAHGKVWHGHPVWFINENPIVGYSKKRVGVEILFWSGQGFQEDDLIAIGKFKAAGAIFESAEDIKKTKIKRWLQKSKKIQWDYANLRKNRKLVKISLSKN